jgi:hypothetical protein
MFQQSRHFTPDFRTWDQAEALAAIREIAADAITALDKTTLWTAHPQDDDLPDGLGSLYFGAAGVIWALDYLHRVQAIAGIPDLEAPLQVALERNAPWFADESYPSHASLLMGDLGIRLVQMRVAPTSDLADAIYASIASNNALPSVELMWGLPGSMLACVHMQAMTRDVRFKTLFQTQATRLLSELETTEEGAIWTQDLYGMHRRWLGAVHGFAGNMVPFLRGWDWLTSEQRNIVADAASRTLEAHAVHSALGANWPTHVPASKPPHLCQHCHGAPGIVTSFADAPFSDPSFEALLLEGGNLTWNAGPLGKGSNLCHGTGGNGYALLKLYQRTRDPLWLERARAFAMAAIDNLI